MLVIQINAIVFVLKELLAYVLILKMNAMGVSTQIVQ